MPRQWVEFLMVGHWGKWMIQCDPPEKRRELEGGLREPVRSLAVRHVSLIYTAGRVGITC